MHLMDMGKDLNLVFLMLKVTNGMLKCSLPFSKKNNFFFPNIAHIFNWCVGVRKLILYPQGDKTCEGKGNISLNVAIDESNSFPNNNWIVCAYLKFFVLNQNTKKYLTIQGNYVYIYIYILLF